MLRSRLVSCVEEKRLGARIAAPAGMTQFCEIPTVLTAGECASRSASA
jgi:hypothetical protein